MYLNLFKMRKEIEPQILKKAEAFLTSGSHDREHIERVLGYAKALQETYGGDLEVIQLGAVLHDLGRSNKTLRGLASAEESVRLATPILERMSLDQERIKRVCQIIAEHDNPNFSPMLLEGKILKDADFLDGLGARGILRSIFWAGESGESVEDALYRLRVKMPERIRGLEFPESRRLAERQYKFVELFLCLLEQPPHLETETFPGKYTVFEGISGSGKETQARMLADELTEKDMASELVTEPTEETREILRKWRKDTNDPFVETFLFIADRKRVMETSVIPALREGKVVIGERSYISTLVYQTASRQEAAFVSFIHSFIPNFPAFDLIFWIDVDPDEAFRRIEERRRQTGQPLGKFESLVYLKRHRGRYKDVLSKFNNVVRLEGSLGPGEIHREVVAFVTDLLSKD